MNQSQITVISRTIDARIIARSTEALPLQDEPNASEAIAAALVAGKQVAVLPFAELKRIALKKIVSQRYSNRDFSLEEIFEAQPELVAAKKRTEADRRSREKLCAKLGAVKSRIVADCKLGRYDVDAGAALDEFEAQADVIVSK